MGRGLKFADSRFICSHHIHTVTNGNSEGAIIARPEIFLFFSGMKPTDLQVPGFMSVAMRDTRPKTMAVPMDKCVLSSLGLL